MYKVFVTTSSGTHWLGYDPELEYETFVEESDAALFDQPMSIDSPEISHWINVRNVLTVGCVT